MSETPWTEIREASDVTDEHVAEAVSMRAGEYGGSPLAWDEVIDRLEKGSDEDWGSDADSPAIRELKRRVRAEMADA